jgi:hypothetical protein
MPEMMQSEPSRTSKQIRSWQCGRGRHREVVDVEEDVVEADEDEALRRACQTRERVGMKARPGVANNRRPRVGTIINLVPMSEGLTEVASVSVPSHRATKREVSMQSTVVGVDDIVEDEDDDVGNEGMVDEDVEGGNRRRPRGVRSCWTPGLSKG